MGYVPLPRNGGGLGWLGLGGGLSGARKKLTFNFRSSMPIIFKPGAMESGAVPPSFEPTYSPEGQTPAKCP